MEKYDPVISKGFRLLVDVSEKFADEETAKGLIILVELAVIVIAVYFLYSFFGEMPIYIIVGIWAVLEIAYAIGYFTSNY